MKLKRIFSIVISFGSFLLLSGCNMAILQPRGTIALHERNLLVAALVLMLLVVVPVIIMTFIFARHFRATNSKAKYRPDWTHSSALEVVWWTIPCVIILILAVLTWVSTHKLDPYRPLDMPGKPVNIEAVALQWRWMFIYPDQHIATINYMEIPANRQIALRITADAPMNSLELPQLAGQIYAMTGMQTKLHFDATTIGVYKGLSTNYSGDGFAGMSFKVNAVSSADFDTWVQQVKGANNPLTMAGYTQLAKASKDSKPQFFSSAPDKLFSNIIMKYMMPAKKTAGAEQQ